MDLVDILVRIIDVTRDPFTLQYVGIHEIQISNRTE
jgi:hypothetical protein